MISKINGQLNWKAASSVALRFNRQHKVANYKRIKLQKRAIVLFCALTVTSCSKLVNIDQPINSITTEGTFSADVTATSAVAGIYSKLINSGAPMFGSGGITLFTGLSSDEITKAGVNGGGTPTEFYSNELLSGNSALYDQLWTPAYFAIFQVNSCLEGLNSSNSISKGVKNQLIGECKFIRAFINFYLTNLWGDIPMPLTADWNKIYLLPRNAQSEVYDQIIADLKEAKELLSPDYAFAANEVIRPNTFVTSALLARVYLYKKEWINAESEASLVINSGLYSLEDNLNDVFLKNSSEAILQFQPSKTIFPYASVEQYFITAPPIYFLTTDLVNAFTTSDNRKSAWTNTTLLSGATVLYPYKYKVSSGTGSDLAEYYVVLRLAEQYLIRAEARAQQNKTSEAKADLDLIRTRAGLPGTMANDLQSLLLAIENERRVELFAEWGHRWFDLIRTNRAPAVLGALKGNTWQNTDQLYPIPIAEIKRNPNLTQNPGYN